jgi:hypothetical protein
MGFLSNHARQAYEVGAFSVFLDCSPFPPLPEEFHIA